MPWCARRIILWICVLTNHHDCPASPKLRKRLQGDLSSCASCVERDASPVYHPLLDSVHRARCSRRVLRVSIDTLMFAFLTTGGTGLTLEEIVKQNAVYYNVSVGPAYTHAPYELHMRLTLPRQDNMHRPDAPRSSAECPAPRTLNLVQLTHTPIPNPPAHAPTPEWAGLRCLHPLRRHHPRRGCRRGRPRHGRDRDDLLTVPRRQLHQDHDRCSFPQAG